MQFVALDVAAASHAAQACRRAASDARRVATQVDPGPLRNVWDGGYALDGERGLWDVHAALLAEARALEGTADAIEHGIVRARRLEERRAAEHAARRAREEAAARAAAATEQRRAVLPADGGWTAP